MSVLILTKRMDLPDSHTLAVYKQHNGYQALTRAIKEIPPEQIIDEVKKAKLNGRGGAGFPAGVKWGFVPKDAIKPKYLCVNADEGEPGTFKDRLIMEKDPHLLIEGIILTCFAIGIHHAYIYVRGEFVFPTKRVQDALNEAYEAGFLGKNILGSGFDLDVTVHLGAGAYICGEETALIESLEGHQGKPRLKPPFPAVVGLFQGPTVVNNVETIANIPAIIEHGGEWFAGLGSADNGGTKLYGVSGHVKKPGIYELPMGTSLREIIEVHCQGVVSGKKLKAVIPGGSSTPVLKADEIDVAMDFASLQKVGTMLGSAGVIVIAEGTCMVWALAKLTKFYAHESCGQCTPCREGTGWVNKIVHRIEAGNGQPGDLELIEHITTNMTGTTICPLAEAMVMPVQGFLKKFRPEFEEHIEQQCCPYQEKA
ncbi:NADH-quinone oxidoreductase subunit NuoF [candidate division CSSED10-310 bacterium]|uniref:NADH-quinone oxidoreductase subunit F n=1 Tax=candidate division CSSED10-310 bacterium TaxID=2855610 RepID=A0ABV6Z2G5_UNCC1